LSVLLPWLFTFVFGVLVPASLSLYSFWRQQRLRQGAPSTFYDEGSAEPQQPQTAEFLHMKRGQIEKQLMASSRILQPQDRCNNRTHNNRSVSPPPLITESSADDDEEDSSQSSETTREGSSHHDSSTATSEDEYGPGWQISCQYIEKEEINPATATSPFCRWLSLVGSTLTPPATTASTATIPSSQKQEKAPKMMTQLRTISGTCAICLHPYQVQDEICWSPNQDCVHAFHVSCISSWLMCRQAKRDCPCCRQSFLP